MNAVDIAGRILEWEENGKLVDDESWVQNNATALARAYMETWWRPIAGTSRDCLPGALIAWIVGGTEHSGASWRREGAAILTLQNDGPFGFEPEGLRAARKRLDMQWVDEITHWRRMPAAPSAAAPVEDAKDRDHIAAPQSISKEGR